MPYARWAPEPDFALMERQLFPDHQQLLAFATQVQLPQSPRRVHHGPLPKDIVRGLLDIRSVDDVLPTLESIATAGDLQVLRDLYMVASKIQEGIRQVQANHQVAWWLSLHCHCNSKVHWACGNTTCKGDRSRRNYQHKVNIKTLLCTFCNSKWELETLDMHTARKEGSWHPRINKHCINPECSRGEGKAAFKTATCSDISKRNGPVLLR